MSKYSMKLCPMRLGFSLGLTAALYMLFLGLAGHYMGWGNPMIELMANLYHGYEATPMGSLIGAGWGFVDGFIGGMLIAFFYNCCCKKCPKEKCSTETSCE